VNGGREGEEMNKNIEREIVGRIMSIYRTFCWPVYNKAKDGGVEIVRHEWVNEKARELWESYNRVIYK